MGFLEVYMSKKALVLLSVVLTAVLAASAPRVAPLCDGFLPKNDLKIPLGSAEAKGITQNQFNAVMDRVEAIYAPIIKARGGRLVLKRLWDDPTVNASAQRIGDDYVLNMYGGLARHKAITQDGMALVACHEMGHHIGGAPLYDGMDWASNEGQADYFANLKCLHKVFASPLASAFTRPGGDEAAARVGCVKSYTKTADVDMCVRESMAGMSVTELFRALRNQTTLPRFDTPDPAVVTEMYDGHPDTQCRLDTYYAGSLCARPVSEEVSTNDPVPGTCTRVGGDKAGFRPRCWYLNPPNETTVSEFLSLTATPSKPMHDSATLAGLKNGAVFSGL